MNFIKTFFTFTKKTLLFSYYTFVRGIIKLFIRKLTNTTEVYRKILQQDIPGLSLFFFVIN